MIKNLMDKLQTRDSAAQPVQGQAPVQPVSQASVFVPPVPRPQSASQNVMPTLQDNIPASPAPVQVTSVLPTIPNIPVQQAKTQIFKDNRGGKTMIQEEEGIIIDLGEGISLNIPIQRRMSLGDFLKVAEKVKALEMLSEDVEFKKNY